MQMLSVTMHKERRIYLCGKKRGGRFRVVPTRIYFVVQRAFQAERPLAETSAVERKPAIRRQYMTQTIEPARTRRTVVGRVLAK